MRTVAVDQALETLIASVREAPPTEELRDLLGRGRKNSWGAACRDRLAGAVRPRVAPTFTVPLNATLFTVGSCFAREIEENLRLLGFKVPTLGYDAPAAEVGLGRKTLPFNKYTPADIYQELCWAAGIRDRDGVPREEDSVDFAYEMPGGGGLKDLGLAGSRPVAPSRFFQRRRELYRIWEQAFSADCVVITLGLIETWIDRDTARVLVDPPFFELREADRERFAFRALDFESCRQLTESAIELIRHYNPQARCLLTTSPIPMNQSFSGEDILVANTRSKSILRTVCGTLAQRYPRVDYFPSYEMVMLAPGSEVWDDNLHHVRPAHVAKIVTYLAETYLTSAAEAHILTHRAYSALQQGDPEAAVVAAETACTLMTDNVDAWLLRAEAEKRRGRLEASLESGRRALALAPGRPEAVRNLVHAQVDAGVREGLPALVDELAGLDSDDHLNLHARARAHEFMGRRDEAIALYRDAHRLQPRVQVYADAVARLSPGT